MQLLSISVHLGMMSLQVIVASLEAMPCVSLTRNLPNSEINQLQLPNEPIIHSVKYLT